MIKTKDGYAKLIGTSYQGNANYLLKANGEAWQVHTGRNNEANKIVRTDTSGYLQTGWINTTSGNIGTNSITKIYCSNDDFIRYKTPENFFSTLANDDNQLSVTVGSFNRKLTINYSNIAKQLHHYTLPYSGTDKKGWYVKIASISLTSRYSSKTSLLSVTDEYTTSAIPRYGLIYVKVQQQEAFGNSPNITLRISGSLTTSLVTGVLHLSSSSSILDVYLKEDLSYQRGYVSIIQGVDTRTGSQELVETLPSGTVINSQYGDISNQTVSLLNSRKINGTSFNGTADITTAYWGPTRTITLTGAITGSASTNGSGNITINTTYDTGNITDLDNRYVNITGDTMTGELKNKYNNAYRLAYGNYGVIHRNDGNNYYILLTNSGEALNGSYNSLRPFYINLSSGLVTFGNNILVNNTIKSSGTLYIRGNTDLALCRSSEDNNSLILTANCFKPFESASNNIDLGRGTAKWRNLYLGANAYIDGYCRINASGSDGTHQLNLMAESTYAKIQSNGSIPLAINPDGNNVGIGLATPSYKLHVNGTFYVSAAAKFNSSILVPYSGSSWITLATRSNIIYSTTNNGTETAHGLYRLKDSSGNAIVFGGLGNKIGFYGFYKSRIDSNTNGTDWSTCWDVSNGNLYHSKSLIISGGITSGSLFINTGDPTLKIYSGKTADGTNDGNMCFQTSIDGTDGQTNAYPTQYQNRCNISLQPRGGQVYIGTNPSTGNTGYKLYVNGNSYSTGYVSGNTLTARVATGTAPLTITSTTKVNNLNVDMLDNYHATGTSGSVLRKSGCLTSSTSGLSSYWGKVASFTWVGQYNDQDITLYMHSAYNSVRGIVHIKARWNSTRVDVKCWVVTGNLIASDLRLYYDTDSYTSPLELWYDIGGQYGTINTTVISETGRTGVETFKIVLYNTSFTSVQTPSISSYISGSYIHLYNSVDVANKLGTTTVGGSTTPIYLSSGSPKTCSVSTSDTANTITVRNSSGDIACRLVRPTYANQTTISGAIAYRVNNSSDNYIRFCSDKAAIRTWLEAANVNHSHDHINSKGVLNPQTGRTQNLGNVYSYNTGSGNTGAPTTYTAIIGFGRSTSGTVEIAGGWTSGMGLWYRSLRDTTDNWYGWRKVWDSGNFDPSDYATADHTHSQYVTSLGTSGNYLTWTRNGTTNNITIPYATNANTLDGYHANTSQNPFGKIPTITSSGVMEVGRYIDFHYDSSDTSDFKTRLQISHNSGSYTATLPAKSGTIAMTSDVLDPSDYYWANIKVRSSSNTSTSPTFSTCYTDNWFRSQGATGWYSETWGGGWYMNDANWVRVWGNKGVYTTGDMQSSGFKKINSSDSYVLLGGGGHKLLSDFAKGNAGSSTQGVYVTGGTVKAMTYKLNATVNSGSSGKLAYYSGTNSIDDYTSTKGSSSTPIYLNAGVPTACTGVMVKYWAIYNINGYGGSSVTYSKRAGNYNFVTSSSKRDTGRYTIGTVYPSGQTWYTTLVWAVGTLNKAQSSNSSNSLLYCTLIRGYQSGSRYYWYINTADDSSTNDGSFDLFFLCF